MNYKKKLSYFFSILIIFSLALMYTNNIFNTALSEKKKEHHLIEVKKGMGLFQVSSLLFKRGIIQSPYLFNIQVMLRGASKKLRVGIYELSPSMTQKKIYTILTNGFVATKKITIPEGFTVQSIAQKLEENKITSKEDFIRISREKEFITSLGLNVDSLEGYLFPDTYFFKIKTKPKLVLKKMFQNLRKKITPQIMTKISKQKSTLHKVLTLASIVEKETSIHNERFLIASVFLNRLKKNMRLQSDPTVIYSLPFFKGKLSKKDLRYNSPYNTYIHRGLPPGPIANPGFESIFAVLNPSAKKFLYFVAAEEKGHLFSRTYKEHRKKIRLIKKQRFRKVDLNYGGVSSSR